MPQMRNVPLAGVTLAGPEVAGADRVLTRDAMEFVAALARRFGPRLQELLARRIETQPRLDAGALPDFEADTAAVREGSWSVAAAPPDLNDRRVEITGPTDAKMMINALNSGARVFMADFEDALSPPWRNVIEGQLSCLDAVRRRLTLTSADGRSYRLGERTATLVVRPRGWHLSERHLLVDDAPVPASLFDIGLYFFHNAAELRARASGPSRGWSIISRHACGTTCFSSPRTSSAFAGAPFAQRCSSKLSWPRFRWTRFFTS